MVENLYSWLLLKIATSHNKNYLGATSKYKTSLPGEVDIVVTEECTLSQ